MLIPTPTASFKILLIDGDRECFEESRWTLDEEQRKNSFCSLSLSRSEFSSNDWIKQTAFQAIPLRAASVILISKFDCASQPLVLSICKNMVQISGRFYGILDLTASNQIPLISRNLEFWHQRWETECTRAFIKRFIVRNYIEYPSYTAPIFVGREGFEIFIVLEEPILINDDDFIDFIRSFCIFFTPIEFGTPMFPYEMPMDLDNVVENLRNRIPVDWNINFYINPKIPP